MQIHTNDRLDEHTYRHALAYLRRHRPNFLFISLLDSDHYGHEHNYSAYRKTLRQYDRWLKQLADTIDSMGEYGEKTTLIVTRITAAVLDWKIGASTA